MEIPKPLLQRCYAHGIETYPDEACGILSGPREDPAALTGFHPIENILERLHAEQPQRYPRTAREGYVLDPLAYMRLDKYLASRGEEIRVIYHTHVDVGAYFSAEDRKGAMWGDAPRYPGIAYLVCGVRQQGADGAIVAVFNALRGDFDQFELEPPVMRRDEGSRNRGW